MVLPASHRQHGCHTTKEARVLNAHLDYKLYRLELERVEKELERRRLLPERRRRQLPAVRFSFARHRRREQVATPHGC